MKSSKSLPALSLVTLALSSFGCAAVQTRPTPSTLDLTVVETQWEATAAASDAVDGAAASDPEAPAAAEETATNDVAMIPVGRIRTVFEGEGNKEGAASVREARLPAEHALRAPMAGAAAGIAPDAVERVVKQGMGQARMCYERGLQRDASLAGRVNVTFTVGLTGKVLLVKAAKDSTLADAEAVTCVERSFYHLSFPRPEGGAVQVTYPIVFAPGA